GETVWPVPSLSVPGDQVFRVPAQRVDAGVRVDQFQDLNTRTPEHLNILLGYEAVSLFVERGRAAERSFALTEQNAAAVVAICRHLDGLPLAIELAAARLRALGVEQIARRLGERFRRRTTGSSAALPRHQTLRAAIDWSYDLLSPEERTLL